MRKGLPAFLTVSCVLVGFQAAGVLTFAAILVTLTSSQRMLIDENAGGVSTLAVSIGSGVLGVSLAGLIVMLARRSRLGRWLTAALELLIFLLGLLLLPVDVATGFFDPVNLWFTAATAAAALILFGLIVNRGVRRYFRLVGATSDSLSP
jgi:hypothetical protein